MEILYLINHHLFHDLLQLKIRPARSSVQNSCILREIKTNKILASAWFEQNNTG